MERICGLPFVQGFKGRIRNLLSFSRGGKGSKERKKGKRGEKEKKRTLKSIMGRKLQRGRKIWVWCAQKGKWKDKKMILSVKGGGWEVANLIFCNF